MNEQKLKPITVFADGACDNMVRGKAAVGVYVPSVIDDTGSYFDTSLLGGLNIGIKVDALTNNEAEYQALILALLVLHTYRSTRVEVIMDSELVVRQMTGLYRVRKENLIPLYKVAKHLSGQFRSFSIIHTHREGNEQADELAGIAAKTGKLAPLPSEWPHRLSDVLSLVEEFNISI